jgi:hypothetical protein
MQATGRGVTKVCMFKDDEVTESDHDDHPRFKEITKKLQDVKLKWGDGDANIEADIIESMDIIASSMGTYMKLSRRLGARGFESLVHKTTLQQEVFDSLVHMTTHIGHAMETMEMIGNINDVATHFDRFFIVATSCIDGDTWAQLGEWATVAAALTRTAKAADNYKQYTVLLEGIDGRWLINASHAQLEQIWGEDAVSALGNGDMFCPRHVETVVVDHLLRAACDIFETGKGGGIMHSCEPCYAAADEAWGGDQHSNVMNGLSRLVTFDNIKAQTCLKERVRLHLLGINLVAVLEEMEELNEGWDWSNENIRIMHLENARTAVALIKEIKAIMGHPQMAEELAENTFERIADAVADSTDAVNEIAFRMRCASWRSRALQGRVPDPGRD